MMTSKQALRALIRGQKQAMSRVEISRRSALLCRQVLASDAYRDARSIYGYLPFNQEVDILPLLRQALLDGKQVALPRCRGTAMHFIAVTDLSHIRFTSFGIPEPAEDAPIARDPRALVLVPGLAFDPRGWRIGYGGGYYDRFLAAEPDHPTLALCYDFQLLDRLDPDPHDIPVDMIFSV